MTLRKVVAGAMMMALAATFTLTAVGTSEAYWRHRHHHHWGYWHHQWWVWHHKDPAATFLCPILWAPVCGKVGWHHWRTFSNACDARESGAWRWHDGACWH
jgi:hypothetical protein